MGQNGKVHKRNRISFSCIACRERKTKCDKLKPTCTKCQQLNIPCIYDAERQPTPRKPTKAAELIHELQKELQYWKSRVQNDPVDRESAVELTRAFTLWNAKLTAEELELPINLCTQHDKLIIHKQMKYYHRPFSILAIVQRDPFLNILTGSVYGATFSDLHIRSKVRQSGRLNEEESPTSEKPPHIFLEKIISRTVKERKKLTNTTDPTVLFSSSFVLEDCGEDEYPPVLRLLLSEIEQILPDIESLVFYLRTFYESIYPMFPFLNVSQFEGILGIILVENDSKYRILLGSSSLRMKLEMLCILMAVLLLTYTSLSAKKHSTRIKIDTHDIFGANQISEKMLVCCERCLCLLNSSMFTNENILCCLLYLKVLESLRPEQGDMVIMQEVLITLSSISEMSLIIGLHKDPDYFIQLKDSRKIDSSIQNYRRKLWLNTVGFSSSMLLPNGSDSRITTDHLLCFQKTRQVPYMSAVKKTTSSSNVFDLPHHDLLHKQYQVVSALTELTEESMHLYKTCSIRKLMEIQNRSMTVLESLFPLQELENSRAGFDDQLEMTNLRPELGSISYSTKHVRNWKTFEMHVLTKTVHMNVCWGVCNFLEGQDRETVPKNLRLFELYYLESFKYCIDLVDMSIRYFTDGYAGAIPEGFHYSSDTTVVTLNSRLYIFMMGFLLRCEKAFDSISSKMVGKPQSYEDSAVSLKLSKIEAAKTSIVVLLRTVIRVSSSNLGTSYLTCQKANSLFEYMLHIVDIGKLSELADRYWDYHMQSKPIPETISNNVLFKWGLDVEDSKDLKEYLHKINSFSAFDCSFFDTLISIAKKVEIPEAEPANVTSAPSSDSSLLQDPPDLMNFFDNFNMNAFEVASVLYPTL